MPRCVVSSSSRRSAGHQRAEDLDPPLHAIEGAAVTGVRRIGKHIIVDLAGDLALLVHLMSAGRLQLFDKRASLRDRPRACSSGSRTATSSPARVGTRQRAWVKVLRAQDVAADDALATLGPEAWPDPPPLRELLAAQGARPLHGVLRDQH